MVFFNDDYVAAFVTVVFFFLLPVVEGGNPATSRFEAYGFSKIQIPTREETSVHDIVDSTETRIFWQGQSEGKTDQRPRTSR